MSVSLNTYVYFFWLLINQFDIIYKSDHNSVLIYLILTRIIKNPVYSPLLYVVKKVYQFGVIFQLLINHFDIICNSVHNSV